MILHQSYNKVEQERIENIFKAGIEECKAALSTLIYSIATLLLAFIHVATFIINFAIGALKISHAVICALRLLLVQIQEITKNNMNTINRRER